jgi:hypothetical protein
VEDFIFKATEVSVHRKLFFSSYHFNNAYFLSDTYESPQSSNEIHVEPKAPCLTFGLNCFRLTIFLKKGEDSAELDS